jgi:hypothetical protein
MTVGHGGRWDRSVVVPFRHCAEGTVEKEQRNVRSR